jgi:hypothetical protein
MNLTPRFSGPNSLTTLTTPVPNGTNVNVKGEPGIRYEWRDGKVVKSINQNAVHVAEGYTFKSDRSGTWKWWASSLALLSAAAVLVWYWRRR